MLYQTGLAYLLELKIPITVRRLQQQIATYQVYIQNNKLTKYLSISTHLHCVNDF